MRITPGICSGPKATPSILYQTNMAGFSFVLKTATNQSVTFSKASSTSTTLSGPTSSNFNDTTSPSLFSSSLAGQFALGVSTCFYPTETEYTVDSPFLPLLVETSGPSSLRLCAGYFLAPPSSAIKCTTVHGTDVGSGDGHDHSNLLVIYHSSEAIAFPDDGDASPNNYTNTDNFQFVPNYIGDELLLPTPTTQVEGNLLVCVVMHRFPLFTPTGFVLDYRDKIAGVEQNITPYYKEQMVSVYSKVVPSGLETNPILFKVAGS